MRKLTKLLASAATITAAAALVASTATTAMADPPTGVAPRPVDIVGVGSNTTEFLLDQISSDYNATVSAASPHLYSWDALPPGVTVTGTYKIVPKSTCPSITRPNGSSAGLTALDANELVPGSTTEYCLDFGRSSSGRSSKAPKLGPGGVAYVAFARDAVTWAVRDVGATKKVPATYAPKSLSPAQLTAIFSCKDTSWGQVGGTPGKPIKAFLPQTGSGTLSFWLKALGLTAPGSCVNQKAEENEGVYSGFNSPNAIFIFSVGSYLSQKYHSAACGKKPTGTQNAFGCNRTGVLGLGEISKVAPTTPGKLINAGFPKTFLRTLYNIVRYSTTTADHIPAYEEPIFAAKTAAVPGYLCSSPVAAAEIADYGFLTTPLCGSIS